MSSDFHIGLLRQTCRFEKNVPVEINPGITSAKRDDYSEFLTCKGYLKEGRGSRNLDSGEIVYDSRTSLRVRFQDNLWNELQSDANKSFKVTIEGRVFTIDGWNKIDERQAYIEFTINEMK